MRSRSREQLLVMLMRSIVFITETNRWTSSGTLTDREEEFVPRNRRDSTYQRLTSSLSSTLIESFICSSTCLHFFTWTFQVLIRISCLVKKTRAVFAMLSHHGVKNHIIVLEIIVSKCITRISTRNESKRDWRRSKERFRTYSHAKVDVRHVGVSKARKERVGMMSNELFVDERTKARRNNPIENAESIPRISRIDQRPEENPSALRTRTGIVCSAWILNE